VAEKEPIERVRTLLLRGDNVLKKGERDKAIAAFVEAREALSDAAPTNGGGPPGRVVSEAFLALRSAVGELEEMDIVLRDIDRGLIDFPAIRDGREVYLCWEEGEDRVEHWHDIDAGFGGRQEL